MTRGPALTNLCAPKPAKPIDVVEQAALDGKRKLLLVRCAGPRVSPSPPTRPPHLLGQAAE
ncbi:MAG: hypothetical protein K8F92_19450 [Hyphomicrobium sp.]|uniref:hypothetical protein n=1 Tax=Hyphomicrobium sp. TaxID=82 RepID=UPI001320FAD1|nr:hypothetical protein [Hyphomicrobium sp.]KAB2938265.1 MAG: hypothetical protein F9K20_18965 [Hyphomicrobium sp.]MBZ0211810.1 hypothetical protein [Hyphomicrobium sp.]MCZ7596058.1 hypothetical protein [Hyphomicrobium sp.]